MILSVHYAVVMLTGIGQSIITIFIQGVMTASSLLLNRGKSMSKTTTLSDEQMQELLQEANVLYALYNLVGRGHVSEWDWGFAYMTDKLPQLIKQIVKEQENE